MTGAMDSADIIWARIPSSLAILRSDIDLILALRGLGRELWKQLGGGEKFI